MFEFEYDVSKSVNNFAKHNIDFEKSKELWADADAIEIPAITVDEPRFLIIGKIDGVHWSAVITYRINRVRIISVRRSRIEEIKIYESARI
ncbi:MAG: BrnT family toxin [Desulfobulbaceae bacterium]|nr:BrnT family toxin [Candidatus Kapabacteria bacterium]MBS4000250.1 BrnT family toxin [Desulfobulbaceae bacterium]